DPSREGNVCRTPWLGPMQDGDRLRSIFIKCRSSHVARRLAGSRGVLRDLVSAPVRTGGALRNEGPVQVADPPRAADSPSWNAPPGPVFATPGDGPCCETRLSRTRKDGCAR